MAVLQHIHIADSHQFHTYQERFGCLIHKILCQDCIFLKFHTLCIQFGDFQKRLNKPVHAFKRVGLRSQKFPALLFITFVFQ